MFEKITLKQWLNTNKMKERFGDVELTEEMYEQIQLPERSTIYSAGYDFKVPFDIEIPANTSILLPSGIKCKFEEINHFLALYPRSSLGINYGFKLGNTTGIIDFDYYNNNNNEGHIFIDFSTNKDLSLSQGDKLCQGIIQQYFIFGNELNPTKTRTGGIGSTGL